MSTQPTSSERLKAAYPNLYVFLVSSFPDSDFEGLEDEAVAERFALVTDLGTLDGALAEGRRLLQQETLPWDALGDWANRNFAADAEARSWLERMLDILAAGRGQR